MSGKERDNDDAVRWLTIRLGSQAIRVGQAMGLSLEPISFDLDQLVAAGEGDVAARDAISRRMVETMAVRSDTQRPSMGQDIRKGRRTETEAINGLVARRGVEVGVDASLHAKLNEIVKMVERGQATPSPALVAGL